jgi:hypothetical protein
MRSTPIPNGSLLAISRALLITSIAWSACAQVQAQAVQKCRIDERIVFQSGPCPLEAPRAASAPLQGASAVGSATPRKKTLADMLNERDAADPAQPRASDGDGAKVLRARMGAY